MTSSACRTGTEKKAQRSSMGICEDFMMYAIDLKSSCGRPDPRAYLGVKSDSDFGDRAINRVSRRHPRPQSKVEESRGYHAGARGKTSATFIVKHKRPKCVFSPWPNFSAVAVWLKSLCLTAAGRNTFRRKNNFPRRALPQKRSSKKPLNIDNCSR